MRARVASSLFSIIVIAFGLAVACGESTTAGTARGSISTASAENTSGLPKYGSPKVTHPLDAEPFRTAPCSALTDAELGALNLRAHGKTDINAPLGPACHWNDIAGATMGAYTVTFVKGGNGLSGAYSNRSSGYFQVLPPIAGYPAVIVMPDDGRSHGDCSIAIGINDRLAIGVGAAMIQGAPNFGNPCGVSAKLGEKIMETIKGAQ